MDHSQTATNHRWWTKETVAVVTGANKGIGYEIVRQLASKDIHVILTSRDEERGVSATKRLHDAGLLNVVFHQLDVQNPTSVAAFAIWMNQRYTKLDILVNNAAVSGAAVDTDTLKARGMDTKQIFKAEAKLILVGGAQGWRYGFNYTDWVSKVAPIRINDTLVFKYAAPGPNSLPHSVYLLRNKKRYRACSLQGGKLLAGPTEGAGKKGFLYKLTKPKRYFFACGAGNGIHCEDGLMKFSVRPC